MATVAQLEDSIRTLPAGDFLQLAEWMCSRHLEVLSSDGFESSELEAEMLHGLEGERLPVDENFYAGIRAGWKKSVQF